MARKSSVKDYEQIVSWYRDWDGPISKRKIKKILHKGVRSKTKELIIKEQKELQFS